MFTYTAECMGTTFTFRVDDSWSEGELKAICDSAMEILRDADDRFSLYKAESEISQLNSGTLDWGQASGAQLSIRKESMAWKEKTGGYFDPVSPDGLYDPSGLVKTWAARNAAQYLEANGLREFTLNAGGDIFLSKGLKSQLLNRVGLSNLNSIASHEAGSNMIIDLSGSEFRAVATSGSAERGEHIWLSEESKYIQATVIATDLVLADIWATALISGGAKALQRFRETVDPKAACALVIGADLGFEATAGFAALLANL